MEKTRNTGDKLLNWKTLKIMKKCSFSHMTKVFLISLTDRMTLMFRMKSLKEKERNKYLGQRSQ